MLSVWFIYIYFLRLTQSTAILLYTVTKHSKDIKARLPNLRCTSHWTCAFQPLLGLLLLFKVLYPDCQYSSQNMVPVLDYIFCAHKYSTRSNGFEIVFLLSTKWTYTVVLVLRAWYSAFLLMLLARVWLYSCQLFVLTLQVWSSDHLIKCRFNLVNILLACI